MSRQSIDPQPSNTWLEEEIDRLKAEVQHLHQENALLMEYATITLPQVAELTAVRDRVLFDLKAR